MLNRRKPKPVELLSALMLLVVAFTWLLETGRPVLQTRTKMAASAPTGNRSASRATSSRSDVALQLVENENGRSKPAVQELDRLLRRGDLCRFLEEWRANEVTMRELSEVLPSDQNSVFRTVRALFKNAKSVEMLALDSEMAQFIYALSVSGLFPLEESDHQDLSLGFELLSKLMREHPDNGAYPAYRAVVRKQRNETRIQIQKDLQLAALAPDFEMHLRSITRPLFEWGLQSPAHYFAGISILSALPIANYNRLLTVIRGEVEAADDAFADQMESLGRKIMQSQNAAPEYREFVDWIAIEYQIGLHIAQVGWKKNHPSEVLPVELRKTYRDFYKKDPSLDALESIFSPDWRCDPVRAEAVLDDEINRERERRS